MENWASPETLRERERAADHGLHAGARQHRTGGTRRYAANVEQLAGLASLSGYADGPQKTVSSHASTAGSPPPGPWRSPSGNRRRTIELAQRENLIGAIGEFVIAHAMNSREAPRSRDSSMAPQG